MFRKYNISYPFYTLKHFLENGFTSHIQCDRRRYERVAVGYIDFIDVIEQRFIQIYKWYFFTLKIQVLFSEEIPSWAYLQMVYLGYTDWRSSAPNWMIIEADKTFKMQK